MPQIRIQWHTYEWFDETFDCPEELWNSPDFDELDWVYEQLGNTDETLIAPVSYERDVDTWNLATKAPVIKP